MKKVISFIVGLMCCSSLFCGTIQEDYQAARTAALQGNSEELCLMYLSESIPKDQEYMYWMIYQTKKQIDWFPSQYALGEAYVEGIPAIKVEQNFSKALYYFQDYALFRPAIDITKNPSGYHWFENGAVLNKLYSLWDKGYQPCVTNNFSAQLSIIPNSIKLTSGSTTLKTGNKDYISIQIKNDGKGDADFTLICITTNDKNIKIPTVSTPLIKPNEIKTIIVPITTMTTPASKSIVLDIEVREPTTMTSVYTEYPLSIQR